MQLPAEIKIDKQNIEDILALTSMQEGMLFHYLKDPEDSYYIEQISLDISGHIEIHYFEQAWNVVIAANEMLRTVFRWEKLEKPSQIILKEHRGELSFHDLSKMDNCRMKTALEEIKSKDRREGFDLNQVPFRIILCKLGEMQYEMVISNHHILYDGWSNGIILKEFFKAYHGIGTGGDPLKFPVKPPFKEFIKWIQSCDRNKQAKYWREYLAGFETPVGLPIKRRIEEAETGTGTKDVAVYSKILEEDIGNKSDVFSKNNRVTLAPIFYAAWGILLQKYCGGEDVIFGTVVSGRPALVKGIENIVGLFINTIPLRVQSAPGVKIIDIVSGIENVLQVREEFESTPLSDIVSYSTVGDSKALFDSIVAIENYPLDSRLLPVDSLFSVNSYSITEMTHYDLTVGIMLFDKIEIKFSYKKQLFEKETIENLARHFERMIRDIIENPGTVLSQLEIISGEEKNRILYDFNNTANNTALEYLAGKTIPQLLAEQVGKSPDRIAVTGSTVETLHAASLQITYRQLNDRVDQLAHLLIARGVLANNIVAVMMERSIEMIIGIFGILKAGGAYLPIDPGYPRERIAYMLKDSGAQIIVGDGYSCSAELDCQLLNVNRELFMNAPPALFPHSSNLILHPDNLAYIIYTSGSTGKPKGALIKIEGLINLLRWYTDALNIGETDNILLIAPISFDLAQKNLFSSFIVGGCLTLASPGIPDYHELSEIIHNRQITLINCAPSVFYPLIESNNDTGFTKLKFLRKIILGGEPIQVDKLLPWVNSGAYGCEIVNTYGPTECTDIASCYRIPNDTIRAQMMIPIGKPIYNVKIFILDKYLNILPVMVSGEICIGEIGVSLGYCNNPGLTLEKFKEVSLFPGKRIYQRIYRSGDIGRWLPDGNIEFLGRIDHQVKVRGFRIELGEIERQLLGNKDVKDAIVVANETNETGKENNYLCAYIITHKNLTTLELREYLAQRLPGYMIPSYFVRLEQIPLTPSGKVDRMSLPGPGIEAACAYAAPRNKIEEKLVEIWSGILGRNIGMNISSYRIGIDEDFFQLGGHSLKATSLASRIYKEFNVKIPLAEIFKRPTIRGLFDYINNYISSAVGEKYVSIEPVEKKEYYILSSAQKRLYFLQQMDNAGTAYNISAAWVLEGIIDKPSLEKVIAKLIKRHESLRTSFVIIGEEPAQRIHEQVEFEIEILRIRDQGAGVRRNPAWSSFIRPFDLSRAPLLRVGLIKEADEKHLLMLDMHHIISDGISTAVLIKEFIAYYSEEILPELQFQYKDFSHWQNNFKSSGKMKEQESFWQRQFEGEIPVLSLPTDYRRPSVQQFAGNRINFEIGPMETGDLKQLALETGSTLYMVLFALFNLFLSKLSGQEDIVVGTVAAGRRRHELENITGMFVNTLVLRTSTLGWKKSRDFVTEVKENFLAVFENQDYPYEDLVEKLAPHRDLSRNPLFDALFVLQNMDIRPIQLPGLRLTPLPYDAGTSKFDISLIAEEDHERICFQLEYSSDLFKESTIHGFINYFKKITSSVLQKPGILLAEIEIISEIEKKRILVDFNNTATDYPADKTIHRLFAEQVESTPDHIALVGTELCVCPALSVRPVRLVSLSYSQLNEQSNRLAGLLIEKGVLADDIIGIKLERSLEMIIGIMGILKAGGAYMPIDPDYPKERIEYMLKDSAARILINKSEIRNPKFETNPRDQKINDQNKNQYFGTAFILNFENLNFEFVSNFGFRISNLSPSNLAYVIYTSGSTGKPKGVMVCHRNVLRLIKNTNFIPLNRETRILQTGAPVFDATTFEIWGSLLNGGQLVLTDKETILDAHRLARALKGNRINTLWLSSPLFNQLTQENIELFSSLQYLLVGGDVLSTAHINRVRQKFPGLSIINGYGPTENTTFSTTYLIDKEFEQNIPIGSPIANSTACIIDRYGHLQPVGIYGELIVGGDGLSRGYLNNPELTAEKFGPQITLITQMTQILIPEPRPLIPKFYKTGDVARWSLDGNIEFLGRIDYQIKIRGFRIELEEIESYLLKFGKIKEAVVIPLNAKAGDKALAAYIVSGSEIPVLVNELREYLQNVLPDYMIPTYFVEIEKLPLTPNGKIDRKLLPAPEIKVGERYAPPGDEIEKKLVDIWSEILGVGVDAIGTADNFFQLGGHSLKAMLMASRIHKEFKVKLPLAEIFKRSTVKELAEFIKKTKTGIFIPIEMAPRRDYYALSASQRRMYLLYRMNETSTVYNMPVVLSLEGTLEVSRFEAVLGKLIQRHESFRTSFEMLNEEAVQRVHDNVAFNIEFFDLATGNRCPGQTQDFLAAENHHSSFIIHHFIRAFDLSQAPLLRVGLVKLTEKEFLLMVDMHHIISDGMSMGIFEREFMVLYADKELPGIRLQYKDYAQWQQSIEVREILKSQEKYWLEQFEAEVPVLNLPTDYVRPGVQSFEGRAGAFEIGPGETTQLKKLASDRNTTLYMVLMSAFGIFLAKLSGQEDIVIGTPTAGRRHADLESIIGMFVKTLALRHSPVGEKSFEEFLAEVTRSTLEAFDNQDYPFEELVEKVVKNRDMGRNPLFDVMFVLQNMEISEIVIPGLKLSPYHYESSTAKFDIILSGVENNGGLHFDFKYCSKLFEETTILRFCSFFKKIITRVLGNPGIQLSGIELTSDEERKQILEDFNDTERQYFPHKTIHRLFEEQATRISDKIAVSGMGQRIIGMGHITYRRLNEMANRLAQLLIEKGVLAGEIIGIMMGRTIEMIIGIFGILKAGGAYLPIAPEYPEERINYMLKDSGVRILINKSEREHPIKNLNDKKLNIQNKNRNFEVPFLLNFENLNLETICASHFEFQSINFNPSNLAYIIYTSGSTGRPKGVMVEHRNLANLVEGLNRKIYSRYNQTLNICLIAPFIFDASIKQLFAALLLGHILHIVPEKDRSDGILLLRDLIKYNVDISDGTPSYLRLLTESMSSMSKDLLLSNVKHFIIGGEALTRDIAEGFFAKFNRKIPGIINIYGPTECTVDTTFFELSPGNIHLFKLNIPIGKPLTNCKVYIVDKYERLQPIGIPGELLVSGNGVGRGYLGKQELTSEKFVFDSFIKGNRTNNNKMYRTGDLARWLPDGNIEFLGRIDYQVKIRGFRIELEEIESCLLKFGKIKEAVVIPLNADAGDKSLSAYIVSESEIPDLVNELREYLQKVLPEYMIPTYFVEIEKLPLTPNGKIDRKLLPAPEIKVGEGYAPPGDEIEKKLVDIWSEILGVGGDTIGTADNFFRLGGHSLKAMLMSSRIHKEFKVKLPLAEIFKQPTIKHLAKFIKHTNAGVFIQIERVPRRDYYTLSASQRRMYLLNRLDKDSTAYNIFSILSLEGTFDVSRFEVVLRKLIERHESFRTSFEIVGEETVQRVHDNVAFEIEYKDLAKDEHGQTPTLLAVFGSPPGSIIKSFMRPFDLSRAPLLRVGLLKQEEDKHLLIVNMHHIISDGMSIAIFVREFMALYEDKELPGIRLQYKDYAEWQQNVEVREILKDQEKYWLEQFAGEIPVLNLPTDYVRPKVQSFSGRSVAFEIGSNETIQLKKLALELNTTLYMIILAAFSIFISKVSGQEDIVMGTPTAGRRHVDLESIIGMFVNTLALRHSVPGEKSFTDFLGEITRRTLVAFENQDYPFDDLVENVVRNRDPGRNPLFDVMFVLQNLEISEIVIPGLKLSAYPYENTTAKFDITLNGVDKGDRLHFDFEYCSKLFDETTIQRFIGFFKNIISELPLATRKPGKKLAELEIIPEEERKQILVEFNDSNRDYPPYTGIEKLFAEQVEKIPDKIALVSFSSRHYMSYKGLDERIDFLGRVLKNKGVGPNCVVALMIERSIEMMVGVWGILKSGGAYLPIDPGYPPERVRFMLEDSESSQVVTRSKFFHNDFTGEVIDIENINSFRYPKIDSEIVNDRKSLIYMIYTSGSTGKPKGVMVQKEGFLNLLRWYIEELNIIETDNNLLIAPVSFDLAQKNLFSPFLSGGRLILASPGTPDYRELAGIIHKEQITMINCAPSVFYPLIELNDDALHSLPSLHSLRVLILGGEPIRFDRLQPWVNAGDFHCEIINTYGPTECTDIAACYRIPAKSLHLPKIIPIGRPIANVKAYILDKYLRVLPVKIPGELCIGGIGLSQGYYNNKQLTEEKFVDAPHLPHLPGKKVYRTGDLTRWLADGKIEFLGRIDHQVKIRGFRIELGEIETELLKHEDIKEAAVISREGETGDNYLCAYIVPRAEQQVSIPGLREYLGHRLPDYMVPAYFIYLECMPLTPSGKIDRRGLPEPEIKVEKNYVAPRDQIEEKLVKIWHKVLGNKALLANIGIDDNFFQLGGHSLKATILTSLIHKELNVYVPLAEIFKLSTIRRQAKYLKEAAENPFTDIESVEEKEYYNLSYSQKRLWYISKTEPDSPLFNMPGKVTLYETFDEKVIRRVLEQLVVRHESLRTSFKEKDKEPVQMIEPVSRLKINFEMMDFSEFTGPEREKRRKEILMAESMHIFNLEKPPLFHVKLIKYAVEEYDVVFNMHHIISDGWSMEILKQEFRQLVDAYKNSYKNSVEAPLEPLELQYKDYAAWQNQLLADETQVGKAKEFWREQLRGNLPVLNLPYDFSRTSSADGKESVKESAGYRWVISGDLANCLRSMAGSRQASLFMVFLAGFNILLAQVSGQEEIMIAIPAAARQHDALKNIIGLFVNTLILCNRVAANEPFTDFFNRLQDNAFKVLEYQGIPLESICGQLKIKYPDVSVFFNMVNTGSTQQGNLSNFDSYHLEKVQDAKFPIVCYLTEYKNGIEIDCHYYKTRFKPVTIEKLMERYQHILESISGDPGSNVGEYFLSGKKRKLKRGGNP